MEIDGDLRLALNREIPILTKEIQALYHKMDTRFRLRGAEVPIRFGYQTDLLGSYTQGRDESEECFTFSLLFVGRGLPHPLSKEEREDLYLHEYAHYMQYNMPIPREYSWQYGTHGSAWKYCCSLVGADPTPFYKAGKKKQPENYEKVLTNAIHDPLIPLRDARRREEEYQKAKNSVVQYEVGEKIEHPGYGFGEIIEIRESPGAVRLHIRFGEDIKIIDQKWLLRTKYKRVGDTKKK